MRHIVDVLSLKYPGKNFFVDHQYQLLEGNTFAIDDAVCVIQDGANTPLLVVEYKPRVHLDLKFVEQSHLSEVFIQAYYLRKRFPQPILHCLTDLTQNHYFLISGVGEKMELLCFHV